MRVDEMLVDFDNCPVDAHTCSCNNGGDVRHNAVYCINTVSVIH